MFELNPVTLIIAAVIFIALTVFSIINVKKELE
jgi:uncharacterized protein YoxC